MVFGLLFFMGTEGVDTKLVATVLALGLVGIESMALAVGMEGLATAILDDVLHERGVVRVIYR